MKTQIKKIYQYYLQLFKKKIDGKSKTPVVTGNKTLLQKVISTKQF
jgi:hypothetical protein